MAAEVVGRPPFLGSRSIRWLRNWRRLNVNDSIRFLRSIKGVSRMTHDCTTHLVLEPIDACVRSAKECVAHGIEWEVR
jgi:hypothetical protein